MKLNIYKISKRPVFEQLRFNLEKAVAEIKFRKGNVQLKALRL